MGAYNCTVGHDRCHVRVLGELFEHVGPNTVLFPACVALEDTVPLAKVGWQFTPLMVGNLTGRHPTIVATLTEPFKRQRDLVPEMESSAELPADSSPLRRVLSSRPRLAVWGVLILLVFAVVMLRFHRITELPPGLHVDAGANGADALEVLQGRHALFFPEKNNGREWLGIYPIALTVSLMGRTELAVRLPTILAGVSAIFAVFWLGRLLFGKDESGRDSPWRGLMIGGVAAGLLVVSTNHTVLGRTANTAQLVMLFLCLSLTLFQWGWGATRKLSRLLVANRPRGRVRRPVAAHLCTRALYTLPIHSFLPEFLMACSPCFLG